MANYNGGAFIGAAVRSVLRQTEASLELIVSDDGSTDESLERTKSAARGDSRLVLLQGGGRTGPGATRNRALAIARGRWIAVVDSDDYVHPERFARLLGAGEADGADIVVDDLLTFYQDRARAPHPHLRGDAARRAQWISPSAYESSNRLLGPGPALGYLKPAWRRALAARYNESLRIGEDSELVLRMLIGGARMRLYPELGYFYRKHDASISHRLDRAAIAALDAAYAEIDPGMDKSLATALKRGVAARRDAACFTYLISALKARDLGAALRLAAHRPSALLLLREPIAARMKPPKRAAPERTTPRIAILSRQRIVGATNGSSAYVLAMVGALKSAGFAVDYVGVSPHIFGRWAVLRLRPEIATFDRYVVHGAVRLGDLVIARDPKLWIAAALAVADLALRKVGLALPGLTKPAEYDKNAAPARADILFTARHAPRGARAVLCDYAFLARYAAYAASPDAPSFVIMHDLLSGRVTDAREQAVTELEARSEFRLLGQADAVIAIQNDEAAKVRAALPDREVIVAPHAAEIAPTAQPGLTDKLLFVGSNTAPNVVGLQWFFREIWPRVVSARPQARLKVAGSVARALGEVPDGVTMLGIVGDLAPLYAEAGVVISPLYTGSGLKIKLIEALAAGKAVVGTPITAQGVEDQVAGAMEIADAPDAFAAAIINLMDQSDDRQILAERALACARAHFSAEASFSALLERIRRD